jgi:hypothetical protein
MAVCVRKWWFTPELLLFGLICGVLKKERVVKAAFSSDRISFDAASWRWVVSILLKARTLAAH